MDRLNITIQNKGDKIIVSPLSSLATYKLASPEVAGVSKTPFVLCEREKLLICPFFIISYVTLALLFDLQKKSVGIMDMLVFAEQVEKEGLWFCLFAISLHFCRRHHCKIWNKMGNNQQNVMSDNEWNVMRYKYEKSLSIKVSQREKLYLLKWLEIVFLRQKLMIVFVIGQLRWWLLLWKSIHNTTLSILVNS